LHQVNQSDHITTIINKELNRMKELKESRELLELIESQLKELAQINREALKDIEELTIFKGVK